MNSIRQIQELNKRELEAGVSPEASWHSDYRDTAYIYIGGLPFEISEGDIITIFSQYGEPTFVELVRDKETGKSKGFAFLKYEDQRSTDLAVDNLGGTTIMNRVLRVDHTRYKKKDDVPEEDKPAKAEGFKELEEPRAQQQKPSAPMLKEERELLALLENHDDDDDPMKDFLIQEKKDELAAALAKKHLTRRSREGHRKHGIRRSRSRSPSGNRRHRHYHARSRSPSRDSGYRDYHYHRRDDSERDGEYKSRPHLSRCDDRDRRERRDGRDKYHSRHDR